MYPILQIGNGNGNENGLNRGEDHKRAGEEKSHRPEKRGQGKKAAQLQLQLQPLNLNAAGMENVTITLSSSVRACQSQSRGTNRMVT